MLSQTEKTESEHILRDFDLLYSTETDNRVFVILQHHLLLQPIVECFSMLAESICIKIKSVINIRFLKFCMLVFQYLSQWHV